MSGYGLCQGLLMSRIGDSQNGSTSLPLLAHEAYQPLLLKGCYPVADTLLTDLELGGNGFGGPALMTPQ